MTKRMTFSFFVMMFLFIVSCGGGDTSEGNEVCTPDTFRCFMYDAQLIQKCINNEWMDWTRCKSDEKCIENPYIELLEPRCVEKYSVDSGDTGNTGNTGNSGDTACTPNCSGRCAGASDGCDDTCSTNDCSGCCSAGNICKSGTTDSYCGKNGDSCESCSDDESCSTDGVCSTDCYDECDDGDKGCVNEYTAWSCKEIDDCYQQVEIYCKSGQRCHAAGYCGEDCMSDGESCTYDQDCCRYDEFKVVYGTGACTSEKHCKQSGIYECVTPTNTCSKSNDCCGFYNKDGAKAICLRDNTPYKCVRTCNVDSDCLSVQYCGRSDDGKKICLYK